MTSPRTLTAGSLHRVAWDYLPVQDQVREALVLGALQRLAQVRGLLCQDDDDFIEVAVGGGPRDAVVTGQRISGGAVAEPPQPQHRLPEAGQRPAAARGAAPLALRGQQLREEPHHFPGHVKRGTISDHVKPSVEGDLG
jgi:hypothetical protein